MSIRRKKKSQLKSTLLFKPEQCKPILSNMAAAGKHGLFEQKINNVKQIFLT